MCVCGGGGGLRIISLYVDSRKKIMERKRGRGGGGQAPLSLMLRARLNPKKDWHCSSAIYASNPESRNKYSDKRNRISG